MLDKTSDEYLDAKERSRRSLELSQTDEVVVDRLIASGLCKEDALEIVSDASNEMDVIRKKRDQDAERFPWTVFIIFILIVAAAIAAAEYYSTELALAIYAVLFVLPFVWLFFLLKEVGRDPDPARPGDNQPASLSDLRILVLQLFIPFIVITATFGALCSRLENLIPGGFSHSDVGILEWQAFALDNSFSGVPFDITDVFELQMSNIKPKSILAKCMVILSRVLIEIYLIAVLFRTIFILRRNGITLQWES